MPAFTASAILSKLVCPGMTSLRELSTAMKGRSISSSVMPSAFEQAAVRRARHPSLDLVAPQFHRPRFLSRCVSKYTKTRCKMHRAGKRDSRATTRTGRLYDR